MRYIKNKFLSIVTLILLVCVILAGAKYLGHIQANPNIDSAKSENQSSQNIVNNVIEITGGSENASLAASKGLRSAVSIYCTFTSSYGGSYPWMPSGYQQTYYSTGSGVIYDVDEKGNAFIITNYHVVYDASSNTENGISDQIYVYLYGLESEQYSIGAQYVGGSSNYDIAVLRVTESDILKNAYLSGAAASVTVADSDLINAGDIAIAIGNPSATDVSGISVTRGIVSVDSEYITMTGADERSEVTYRVIRVDTPINSGNSGGGLFDGEGNLIGIVNAKISTSSIENIGYAIPSSIVRAVADNIIDYCYYGSYTGVMRCILGITIQTSGLNTSYDSESGIIKKLEDVTVSEISSGSLADGKLKAGDVIKSITIGQKTTEITRRHHLIDTMLDARVGDTVTFTVERNGVEKNVSFIITQDYLTAY